METAEKFGRFSSCRGVAFEVKPHSDPFAISNPSANSKRYWFPWGRISKIVPDSDFMQRTVSKSSSHFCDLDDDEEDVITLHDIEEGHEEKKADSSPAPPLPLPPPPPASAAAKPKPKSHSRLSVILLDQGLFTVYKRLFMVGLSVNMTMLVLAATGNFQYARNHAAVFSSANIFFLILCRNEIFLRGFFWVVVNSLGHQWVPLRLKTMATSLLQSVGGIHSSCGISSIAWLTYALILTLKNREDTSPAIIGVASTILGVLCLSAMSAFPLVRHLWHNLFERTHRFAGWLSLILLWIFIILTISYDPDTKSYSNDLASGLIKRQEFWFTLGITILTIVPWLTVRRVPVRVYSPSSHASIIKFEGGVKAGILGRISPSPLSEWHAFGIISDGKKEHMMLAGAVGDYTKSLVTNPPSHLWVRKVHFPGLPYLANMYKRMLLVATGSGICVFLSLLLQPVKADVWLLWVTKGAEQNFGKEIMEMLDRFPKDKVVIHDTAVLGRPNVGGMSVEMAKKIAAEVVFITSNPEGSKVVVNACKAVGIPAFAPIWDS